MRPSFAGGSCSGRIGRTTGTGAYPDSTTFRETLRQVLHQLKRDQRRLSQRNVAQRLNHTERHVRRLFQRHVTLPTGETWKTFTDNI
jgi:hypothetical protein